MFPEGRILDFVIVGAVALIVVGPKDLPILMRRVGQALAKMRAMAAEFRASFDELARQSELDELRREVEALRHAKPLETAVLGARDASGQTVFDDIHASLGEAVAPSAPPAPGPAQSPQAATPPAQPVIPEEAPAAKAPTAKARAPRKPRPSKVGSTS